MERNRAYSWFLVLIFLFALAMRLYFSFQSENFEIGDAYFNYAQADMIKSGFLPSYFDDLSYSGRTHIFPPVYYYLLSFFSFFLGTPLALKVIPNILACLLVIIIYFIVLEITGNKPISLFSSFSAAFIPIFFIRTFNSASIFSFILPLVFSLIYCFIRIRQKKFLYLFLFLSLVLSLTSAISFFFVFSLLLYLLLTKLEYKTQNRTELEAVMFVTFLTLWVNVLIYKNAFLFHSYSLIWQNLPSQVLSSYFKDFDIITSITGVGLVPLLLGIYAVYRYMFKERDKNTYLLMAFALAVALLLWFKLITIDVGLMFLGAILIPLLAQTLGLFFKYIDMTKIASYRLLFWIPIIAVFILTAVLPCLAAASAAVYDSVTPEEIDALLWIKKNTPDDSVVLSSIDEGYLISAIAVRKNVADSDFILVRSSDIVFDDVAQMYRSILKTKAVDLMNKYDVDYVYFSPRAKEIFGIESLRYAEEDCFKLVYDSTVQIYRVVCEMKSD